MFRKILIANRGEIACRLIRTARHMGISTVAVYSEADRHGLHVKMADEAVFIGPAIAAHSYLNIDAILDAAQQTGAEAIHPGYGFLSERAPFARRVQEAGLVFIGPSADVIEAMGDKIRSKQIAQKAGVSIITGTPDGVFSAREAVEVSANIGYPVMIKASAGGGGKGMRIAWTPQEVEEAFDSASREAVASFGDGRLFIEKYVVNPRHIEIQILADTHGNVVYLGERECSLQRRHQKVIEEAPSPFLDALTREAMGTQAVALAKAVGYQSAGTVEFIVDKDKNFYFLEMNTRLQVEHPVTEAVTGLDLVQEMIRLAAGERLGYTQQDIKLTGWSVEARVYAESAEKGFLPSTGRLVRYLPPLTTPENTVRIDTGVEEGSEISVYYDPMIAKVCTKAPTRQGALEALGTALDSFYIEGIDHNIPFLNALIHLPQMKAGDIHTHLIGDTYPTGFIPSAPSPFQQKAMGAVALFCQIWQEDRLFSGKIPQTSRVLQEGTAGAYGSVIKVDHLTWERDRETATLTAQLGEETIRLTSSWTAGNPLFEGLLEDTPLHLQVAPSPEGLWVSFGGCKQHLALRSERTAHLALWMKKPSQASQGNHVVAPCTGQIKGVYVTSGENVQEGQPLFVLEAMKMENTLRAPRTGIISTVHVSGGDVVTAQRVLCTYAP